MYLHCKKCLTSRTGDVLGASCQTPGCDGLIEEEPAFSTLVDTLPEPMTCGRRFDTYVGNIPVHSDREEGKDSWQKFKSNGDRVCSYCGSLHWKDFFRLVKESAEAPEDAKYGDVVSIEPSDKNYKVYVHRRGVRNAHEGGIKFYKQHIPRKEDGTLDITAEQEEEYGKAVRASSVRFQKYMSEMYPRK